MTGPYVVVVGAARTRCYRKEDDCAVKLTYEFQASDRGGGGRCTETLAEQARKRADKFVGAWWRRGRRAGKKDSGGGDIRAVVDLMRIQYKARFEDLFRLSRSGKWPASR